MEEATKVGIVYNPGKDLEESKEMKAIQQLMLTAQQLQSRLKKLWEIRNMVERMDQRTLAEIKSFKKPKPEVEKVMKATLILLGIEKKEMKTWKECVVWIGKMGKESIKRRISNFIIQNVSEKQMKSSEKLIHDISVEQISIASAGASIFYRWTTGVLLWLVEERDSDDAPMRRATQAAKIIKSDEKKDHVYNNSSHHDGWQEDGGQLHRV